VRACAWLIFLIATLWALAIVGAPHLHVSDGSGEPQGTVRVGALGGAPLTPAAVTMTLVYLTGAVICHQRPERSFHAGPQQYPVCARCTGLYVGAPFGLLAMLMMQRVRTGTGADAYRRWRVILLGAMVPTLVSIGLERIGGPSDTISRALAALPLGAAVAAFVAAALLGHFAHAFAHAR